MKLKYIILSDNEIILFIEWLRLDNDKKRLILTALTWTPPLHTPRPTCLQLAVSGGAGVAICTQMV